MMRDLRHLPKAHLHMHLEGSAPRHWVAARLSASDDVRPLAGTTTFAQFHQAYVGLRSLVRTPDDLADLLDALLADEAAQGVRYIEPTFRPQHYAAVFGWQPKDVLDYVVGVAEKASARHGVRVGFMVAVDHAMDTYAVESVARFAADNAVRLAAFGINGDDSSVGPARFVRAGAIARDAGLAVVPHTGEFSNAARVLETLTLLNPDRLAHGVRGVEDAVVLSHIAERQVPCDVCMTSNLRLGVAPSAAAHPLWCLLEAGAAVTLNADDSYLFETSILQEYVLARDSGGLTDDALAEIAATSFRVAAGLSKDDRATFLKEVEAWLQSPKELA